MFVSIDSKEKREERTYVERN